MRRGVCGSLGPRVGLFIPGAAGEGTRERERLRLSFVSSDAPLRRNSVRLVGLFSRICRSTETGPRTGRWSEQEDRAASLDTFNPPRGGGRIQVAILSLHPHRVTPRDPHHPSETSTICRPHPTPTHPTPAPPFLTGCGRARNEFHQSP